MNHSYRLVWNDRTERFVPAPETATARGKCGGTRPLNRIKPLLAALAAVGITAAHAAPPAPPAPTQLPDGGRVVAGQASIAQTSPVRMDITQTSNRAILEWNRFDIGSQAQVNFAQPSASSVALNRVLAGDATQIMGQLTANGQVWLMNPAGVIFGAGSRVDVGGIVATSMNITNEDFLAGRAQFQRNGAVGKVENHGQINGQLVALLAPEVINEGIITARMGNVVLAAGDRITLEAGANGYLQVAVDPATVSTLVDNRHLIQADGGQVLMSAQASDTLLSAVVANSGTVQAQTLENRAGKIFLLADMAQGEVKQSGLLDASAPTAGDGGFIETSAAKVGIDPAARVTTRAANGKTGTWLIDPNDYTIAASGGDITGTLLSSQLNDNNITIQSANGATSGNGDIFVNDTVSWSANKLTLSAVRDIHINRTLNGSGTAQLALEYGQGAVAAGNTADYYISFSAPVNLPAGQNFSTKLGSNGATETYTVITSLGAEGSTTGTDLQGMNGNLSGKYALGANIDASATSGWNSGSGWQTVGADGSRFSGKFSGLGHTVSNIYIYRPSTSYIGLFGYANSAAALRDIGLQGISVSGTDYVGGLVADNAGTISNSYASGSVSGTFGVGGLAAGNGGTISNSYASGSVSGSDNVGGLAGHNWGAISNSYATGSVSGAGSGGGGLVGVNDGTISNSYASGSVSGAGNGVGGLAGFNLGTISNSYATGSVSGGEEVGGLAGYNWGAISNSYATGSVSGDWDVGGLVGVNYLGAISNSYATGSVSGTDYVGGLVGGDWGATSSSYWNTETSGPTSSGGTGKTTAEMKQQATYSGWDFDTVWRIYAGQTTPVLRALQQNLTVTANADTKTYDGLAYSGGNGVSYSVSGATVAGTLSYSGTSQGATNAGSYTLIPNITQTQADYQRWGDIIYVNGTLTIAAATTNNDDNNSDSQPVPESRPSGGSLLRVAMVAPEVIAPPSFGVSGAMPFVNIPDNFVLLPGEE